MSNKPQLPNITDPKYNWRLAGHNLLKRLGHQHQQRKDNFNWVIAKK